MDAIPFTDSQQIPVINIKQGNSTPGFWSLWHLEVKNQFENSQVIQPLFISNDGQSFTAFAQNIWDKIVQEKDYFDCKGVLPIDKSKMVFEDISEKSEGFMKQRYEEFENSMLLNSVKIKSNKEKSFVFQEKQLNRIGIENIKLSRLNRLNKEKEIWEETFQSSSQIVPSLTCLLLLKVVNG
jgi:hypothetical protein